MEVYNSYIQSQAEIRPVTNFECIDGEIVVRQRETDKLLYETFKLDETDDNALYGNCSSGNYLFYDIEASSGSDDPGMICMYEIER